MLRLSSTSSSTPFSSPYHYQWCGIFVFQGGGNLPYPECSCSVPRKLPHPMAEVKQPVPTNAHIQCCYCQHYPHPNPLGVVSYRHHMWVSPTTILLQPNGSIGREYGVGTWSVVEVSIGIFSACLPVMQPLLQRFIFRRTAVEESHSMQITSLQTHSNGKTTPEQHLDINMSGKPWQQQQQPCQDTSRAVQSAKPQRLNNRESVMSMEQWRDPENMHPGDLLHVYNSSHGTAEGFRSGGVEPPTTTTTNTTTTTTTRREFRYGLWPVD